jgi:hypothetical protein
MAGIEDLSPEELKQYRLGKMLLEANPEIADEAKRLALKVDPKLKLPEITLADRIAEQEKKRIEWEEKQEERAREERVHRRRKEEADRAIEAGFTPEEIEKIVVDEKCSFPTAIKLATLQRESAVPGPASFANGDPLSRTKDGDVDWRKLSPTDQRRKGLEIAHQGIEDMIRRARTGR